MVSSGSEFDSTTYRFIFLIIIFYIYFRVSNANWNRECGPNMKVYQTASLKRWYAVYPRQMEKEMTKFIRRVIEIGRKMTFHIATPRAYVVLKIIENRTI